MWLDRSYGFNFSTPLRREIKEVLYHLKKSPIFLYRFVITEHRISFSAFKKLSMCRNNNLINVSPRWTGAYCVCVAKLYESKIRDVFLNVCWRCSLSNVMFVKLIFHIFSQMMSLLLEEDS